MTKVHTCLWYRLACPMVSVAPPSEIISLFTCLCPVLGCQLFRVRDLLLAHRCASSAWHLAGARIGAQEALSKGVIGVMAGPRFSLGPLSGPKRVTCICPFIQSS